MPAYVDSPNAYTPYLMDGVNCYLLGSYNAHQANTKMFLSNVALTSNVATVTGTIVEGEVPLVGSYISITQTTTSAGVFNVNRAIVTAVSINNAGVGTVSFALTNANIGSVGDTGTAIIEVMEVPETIVAGASIACCMPPPRSGSQRSVTTSVTFPTLPTAVTVALQEAVRNVNSEFTTLGTVATVAGSAVTLGPAATITLTRGNFYRFLVSGLTGTGKIVAKIV